MGDQVYFATVNKDNVMPIGWQYYYSYTDPTLHRDGVQTEYNWDALGTSGFNGFPFTIPKADGNEESEGYRKVPVTWLIEYYWRVKYLKATLSGSWSGTGGYGTEEGDISLEAPTGGIPTTVTEKQKCLLYYKTTTGKVNMFPFMKDTIVNSGEETNFWWARGALGSGPYWPEIKLSDEPNKLWVKFNFHLSWELSTSEMIPSYPTDSGGQTLDLYIFSAETQPPDVPWNYTWYPGDPEDPVDPWDQGYGFGVKYGDVGELTYTLLGEVFTSKIFYCSTKHLYSYQNNGNEPEFDVSLLISCDITVDEYWPYKNSANQPVWDTSSGAQINDPCS